MDREAIGMGLGLDWDGIAMGLAPPVCLPAEPMAAGGADIIEDAKVYDDVGAAAHDLTFLAALSARRRATTWRAGSILSCAIRTCVT